MLYVTNKSIRAVWGPQRPAALKARKGDLAQKEHSSAPRELLYHPDAQQGGHSQKGPYTISRNAQTIAHSLPQS